MGSFFDKGFDEAARMFVQGGRVVFRVFRVGVARWDQGRRAKQGIKPYMPDALEVREAVEPISKSRRMALNTLALLGAIFFACFFFKGLSINNGGFLVLVGLVGLGGVGWAWRKWRYGKATSARDVTPLQLSSVTVYNVHLPRGSAWDSVKARQLMSHLLANFGCMYFQIVADKDTITWRLVDLRLTASTDAMVRTIRAFYPDAEVKAGLLQSRPFQNPFYRMVLKGKPASAVFPAPVVRVDELKDFDPLLTYTQAVSELEADEYVTYTLAVTGFARDAHERGMQLITTSNINIAEYLSFTGAIDATTRKATGQDTQAAYADDLMKEMQDKLEQPLFHALLTIQIDAPTRERVEVLTTAATHVLQFAKAHFNAIILHEAERIRLVTDDQTAKYTDTLGLLEAWLTNRNELWQDLLLVLEPAELAALWHLPNETFTAQDITWLPNRQVPLPAVMRGKRDGISLGTNRYAGREEVVCMLPKDRAGHMIVVGKTGMGKSTFLHNLIRQDIAAGRGVAVIDPSPTDKNIVPRILQQSIPENRKRDVVVLDLSDRETPPPLNILSTPTNVPRRDTVASIRAIFERVYGGNFSEARMGRTLGMALHTVLADPTPTVRDISRVWWDMDYRDRLLDQVTSEGALDFWDRFERMTAGEQEAYFEPILGRIEALYDNELLYPAVCHPDPLNLGTYIQEQKIILISLAPPRNVGLAPSEQALLGSVLVSQFQQAVMAQRPPERFYLYIDEAQHFVTTALPELFNEARGQNLSLTLSNQFLKQLVGSTLQAVMGNVGAIVSFQVGSDDAQALATDLMKPNFTSFDLTHMEVHHAAVSMRYDDKQQEPFSLQAQNVPEPPADAARREAEIRALSHQQYTPRTRQDILDWLTARYPPKRRRRGTMGEEQFSDPL